MHRRPNICYIFEKQGVQVYQIRPDQTRPDQTRIQSRGPYSRTCVLVNALSSPAIYHATILRDFLMKYRPFKCNSNHKFKNIDHLRKMVDNIDPLPRLSSKSTVTKQSSIELNFVRICYKCACILPIFLQ